MNRFFLIITFVLTIISVNIFGQEDKYRIQILNDGYTPQKQDFSSSLKSLKSGSELKGYKLIQFYSLPTKAYRTKLKNTGVELVEYIPNFCYVAYIHSSVNSNVLQNNKIRAVIDLDKRFKLGRELYEESFEKRESDIMVRIFYHTGVNPSYVRDMISKLGNVIEHFPDNGSIDALMSYSSIDSLIPNADIRYIEKIKEPVIEDAIINTSGRTNWLNTRANSTFFDGSGTSVSIQEGRAIDVNQKIELQGRLQEDVVDNNGAHKTLAAIHMAGAGNLNPLNTGIAQGARVISQNNGNKDRIHFDRDTLVAINHSYGYGKGTSAWAEGTRQDKNLRDGISAFHVWSSGNQYSRPSNYGPYVDIEGYANLTGGIKMAKNTLTVGSVNQFDVINSHSSKGPTVDGRIKPDIMVEGRGGTSFASPKITGIIGQLVEAYKHYNKKIPYLPVIKTILLNTCDDIDNPGPDFRTGYGRVNVRRAHEVIKENQIIEGVLDHNEHISYTLNVPDDVKEVRVLIHWPDYPATSSIPAKALVNDLDLSLTDPLNKTYLPWVLSHYAHVDSLGKPAVRGADHLNNAEQITVRNPVAGDYTIDVDGHFIPQGQQPFFVTYEFLYNELSLTYPIGTEHLVPGEFEYILWDSYGNTDNQLFDLDYTTDDGATWVSIAKQVDSKVRTYKWQVPYITSGNVKVRVKRGEVFSISKKDLNINSMPGVPQVLWRTDTLALIAWEAGEEDASYRVNVLGERKMMPLDSTGNAYYLLRDLVPGQEEWVSIQKINNKAVSRRTMAARVSADNFNDNSYKIVLYPVADGGFVPYQIHNGKYPITVKIRNEGKKDISDFSIKYKTALGQDITEVVSANVPPGGYYLHTMIDSLLLSPSLEIDTVNVWAELNRSDAVNSDTSGFVIQAYDTQIIQPPYVQNFDAFTACSKGAGCESVRCPLSGGWFNVSNNSGISDDMIDWRAISGTTPTAGTGPDSDHTSGHGKYLYLEGSSSGGGGGCGNSTALVHSPCIDLSSAGEGDTVSFWCHMRGDNIGSLHLDVYLNDKWINDIVAPVIGHQSSSWQQFNADIAPYAGQVVVFRIRGRTGGGWKTDMAIDDFSLKIKPKAAFDVSTTTACLTQHVEVTNAAAYSDSYKWTISPPTFSFEEGTDSTSENPVFSFTEPGEYSIKLKCSNEFDSDSLSLVNKIYVPSSELLLTVNGGSDTTYCENTPPVLSAGDERGRTSFYSGEELLKEGAENSFIHFNAVNNDAVYAVKTYNDACVVHSDTLVFHINPVYVTDTVVSVWDNYISPSGEEYTASGVYLDTLTSSLGCDSVIQINLQLKIKPKAAFDVSTTTACLTQHVEVTNAAAYSDSYKWTISPPTFSFEEGTDSTSENPVFSFTEPGEYSIKLKCSNEFDSDSLSLVNKIYVPSSELLLTVNGGSDTTYCENTPPVLSAGDERGRTSFYSGEELLKEGAENSFIHFNAVNNDAVYAVKTYNDACVVHSDTLVLHNSPIYITDTVVSACDNYISPSGEEYTASGVYLDTLTSSLGCDSIVQINLNLHSSTFEERYVESCGEYKFAETGEVVDQSGVYMHVSVNANGCEHVLATNLIIHKSEIEEIQQDSLPLLYIREKPGVLYQWINCSNDNEAIGGSNGSSFTPTNPGAYACVLTNESTGCKDTTLCFESTALEVNDFSSNERLTVYPNPANGTVNIKAGNLPEKVYQIKIISITGASEKYHLYDMPLNMTQQINLTDYETGVYVISLIDTDNNSVIETQKLVVY